MMLKSSILAGLFMLLSIGTTEGRISTMIKDGQLIVETDKAGVDGYKGCDEGALEQVPAYVFKLQKQKNNTVGPTCNIGKFAKWVPYEKKETNENKVVFEGLPEGTYRIVCLSGEAIGCSLEGKIEKSIVYAFGISDFIDFSENSSTNSEPVSSTVVAAKESLKVFPNPTSNTLNIHLLSDKINKKVSIVLYNLLGQAVLRKDDVVVISGVQNQWQLNVQKIVSGAYILRVADEHGTSFQQKIIVE